VVAALLGGAATAAAAAPSWVPPAPEAMVTDRVGVLSPGVARLAGAQPVGLQLERSGHKVWLDRTAERRRADRAIPRRGVAAWKIGRKGLDDGLAIFAMTEDRAIPHRGSATSSSPASPIWSREPG